MPFEIRRLSERVVAWAQAARSYVSAAGEATSRTFRRSRPRSVIEKSPKRHLSAYIGI